MSQENLEIVREGIEAWNRRDAKLWLTYAAPEIEWSPAGPAAVERTVYRGYEEVTGGLASVWEAWEEFRLKELEVRDLGDSVLWLGRVKMKGGSSHVELDQEFAFCFVLDGGRIVRVQAFPGWADALQAMGL